jgi:hypothetical protein
MKQKRRDGSVNERMLETSAFRFTLDTSDGLKAVALENRLTGAILRLEGPELAVDLDASDCRLGIAGWRCLLGDECGMPSDDEAGFLAGRHLPGTDDSAWTVHEAPNRTWWNARGRLVWARTQLVLPREFEGRLLTLVLGGFGLHDYRHLRVFLNGVYIGERHTSRFWEQPGRFPMAPGTDAYRALRWGAINHIAIQAGGIVDRTARLDAVDPLGGRHFPGPEVIGSPFEQYLVVGEEVRTPRFTVTEVRQPHDAALAVDLRADGLAATVIYRLHAGGGLLHKHTELTNTGASAVRVLNVRLGDYATGAAVTPGDRGFPVYADDAVFFSLAHPAGWATGEGGRVLLQQHPGILLEPGATFAGMEAVVGVAAAGQAKPAFVAHVRERCRRVRRGHDKPYAVFENFGAWLQEAGESAASPWFTNKEAYVQHSIARLGEAQRDTGLRFDLFSVDFWVDAKGNLEQFNRECFPNGLAGIRRELAALGTAPGLWIDSSMSGWSIGGNPDVQGCFTCNADYMPKYWSGAFFCRATDPIRTLYKTAFRRHLRENGVRHLKFDNLHSICFNTRHAHLPGLYSTEAIHDAVIEALRGYDEECPEVFLFLYWGYRSPWWLLHGDVLFEPGLNIEAASPSGSPTLYVRDGVTVGLDQAQWWCEDIPPIGKDSLGVWLSNWPWNSCIGAERWQEGFIMDLCRGSLLAQPWSDRDFLDTPGRRQMADFIALLRAQPACFGGMRFILGNPWKSEPYGYCGTDGARAFVALNNCTWDDAVLPLQLNSAWGLPDGETWDVYRWYPDPAKLGGQSDVMALRPFEVVLLEVVRRGSPPSLGRDFPERPGRSSSFAEPSRAVSVESREPAGLCALPLPCDAGKTTEPVLRRTFLVSGVAPASAAGGTLAVTVELFKGGRLLARQDSGQYVAATAILDGQPAEAQAVVRERGYPSGWQAWRMPAAPATQDRPFSLTVTVAADPETVFRWKGRFVPDMVSGS